MNKNPYAIAMYVFLAIIAVPSLVIILGWPLWMAWVFHNWWFLILYPVIALPIFLRYKMYTWEESNGKK